jgi:hypothetical protein
VVLLNEERLRLSVCLIVIVVVVRTLLLLLPLMSLRLLPDRIVVSDLVFCCIMIYVVEGEEDISLLRKVVSTVGSCETDHIK